MSERAKELYYLKWLPKMRKAFAHSGRLTELAQTLAQESGLNEKDWRPRLQRILAGHELAPPDLVFRIDRFLAPRSHPGVERSPELPWK